MLRSMVGRLMVSGALLLCSACGSPDFSCQDDEQCTLAGEPGTCIAGGRCAYPEPACPSGLVFPIGASHDAAGECVAGEASDSGGGSGPGGTTTEADTGESATDAAGEETSPPDCGDDPYEPNDEPMDASPVTFDATETCQASWEAVLPDALDADWFGLAANADACALAGAQLTFVTNPSLDLCAIPICEDAPKEKPLIVTCDGTQVPLPEGDACCSEQEVRLTAECSGGQPVSMLLGVAASSDPPACLTYEAVAFL